MKPVYAIIIICILAFIVYILLNKQPQVIYQQAPAVISRPFYDRPFYRRPINIINRYPRHPRHPRRKK